MAIASLKNFDWIAPEAESKLILKAFADKMTASCFSGDLK
jgi:hypothetical protein